MNKKPKTLWVVLGIVAIVVVICLLLSLTETEDFHDKYAGQNLNVEIPGYERTGTYSLYVDAHKDAAKPEKTIDVDLFKFTNDGNGKVSEVKNYEGADRALFTDNYSNPTWTVNVPEAGFYNIYMEYFIPESKGVIAERQLFINGETPFSGADNLSFTRIWTDGGPVRVDNQGNEIRPTQAEIFDWQSSLFKDELGYVSDPYMFYFEKGNNTITLYSENEPMYIKKLSLQTVQKLPTYDEYIASQPYVNASDSAKNFVNVIQGESAPRRSESSLYAKYDRSSPTTQPNSVSTTVLNYAGGEAWRASGMWIEWDFEVPEDGFYNIMIKGRQNYQRGSVSNRTMYIDGEIPFKEMQEIAFSYSNDWDSKDLADKDGNLYNFYLTKGSHTLRLEASLGGLGDIVNQLEDSTFRLNLIYRKLLVYTGANPDKYRDYKVDSTYPEIMEAMNLERMRLYKIVDDMVEYSGQKADLIANAQTVAVQLERFVEKPQKITTEFMTFKDNVTMELIWQKQ